MRNQRSGRRAYGVLTGILLLAGATVTPAAAQGVGWAWLAWDPAEEFFESSPAPEFLDAQLQFPRVRAARAEKRAGLVEAFRERGLTYPASGLYLRVFKRERLVEAWVRPLGSTQYALFKTYPMCVLSGTLGPKRRVGDLQVPEGYYGISNFNPVSEFHLSLGISYPNRADALLGDAAGVGGDIFFHGGCQTIGCVPMTDEHIKELYWLTAETRAAGQRNIPVHIYPTRLDETGMAWLREAYAEDGELLRFWDNLRGGFEAFESSRQIPLVAVSAAGDYVFGDEARRVLHAASLAPGPALVGRPADEPAPSPALPIVAPSARVLAGEAAAARTAEQVEVGLIPSTRRRAAPQATSTPRLIGEPADATNVATPAASGPHARSVQPRAARDSTNGPVLVGAPYVPPADSTAPADTTRSGGSGPRR